jgi:GT2 family glycosyltransferase
MFDLLRLEVAENDGADMNGATVTVSESWGSVTFQPIKLAAGWYYLHVSGDHHAACLEMVDANDRIVEIASDRTPQLFVKLAAGTFNLRLICAARPGIYRYSQLTLNRMRFTQVIGIALRRGWHILIGRDGSRHILSRLRRILSRHPEATGFRASAVSSAQLGVLTGADLDEIAAPDTITEEGPLIFVRYRDATAPINLEDSGLAAQSYRRFTTAPDAQPELVVYLGYQDRLTPDALQRFVDAAHNHPEADVFLADTWIDAQPTIRPAFDPLLYCHDFPTPYAVRASFVMDTSEPWRTSQARYRLVACPLATTSRSDPPPHELSQLPSLPSTTIIIPTRDRADLLSVCLGGLFDTTDGAHEVIVVDNGSVESATFDLLASYRARGLRVIRYDIPFNFARLCNLAAAEAGGDYLVFLNNDIRLTHPDWLTRMLACAVLPDVGAVGARLVYPDATLQHGGIALGLTEVCGHLWRGLSGGAWQDVPQLRSTSLRMAVTGALLCVARDKFEAVGGFDATLFPVSLNDVDLCLRLMQRGWFSVLSNAEAVHQEQASRGEDTSRENLKRRQQEIASFTARWGRPLDPWLPAAVMRSSEAFIWR